MGSHSILLFSLNKKAATAAFLFCMSESLEQQQNITCHTGICFDKCCIFSNSTFTWSRSTVDKL